MRGPASQGKNAHFRAKARKVLSSFQKFAEREPKPVRAAAPMQSRRSPPGGREDPKQCPDDA